LRGRLLFGKTVTSSFIEQQLENGASIQATTLRPELDYPAFQSLHGSRAVPLMLLNERRQVIIYTDDYQPLPAVGQTLISLVPPPETTDAVARMPAGAEDATPPNAGPQ
jgi:hypothetical protein